MKEYNVYQMALGLGILEGICMDLHLCDVIGGEGLDDEYIGRITKALNTLKVSCESLNADGALLQQISSLVTEQTSGNLDRRHAVVNAKIRVALDGVDKTLSERKFFVLSKEEAEFQGNPKLFGESFPEKYSIDALRDALAAGGCYAASQYTACVFHCMRVAEHGLRKLASNRMLRVKITDHGKVCPIEYGTWNKVITAIRAKITKIRNRPDSVKKDDDLKFFSSAADQCEYMKDIWRNEISHTRRWYKKEEALAVINRVKDFVRVVGDHKGSPIAEDTFALVVAKAVDAAAKTAHSEPLALPARSQARTPNA